MLTATGTFQTPNASRYLQQLCKHFAHKVTVEFDETHGKAEMPGGPAEMWASENELKIRVSAADEEGMVRAQRVVDVHLERFAFREEFKTMNWLIDTAV